MSRLRNYEDFYERCRTSEADRMINFHHPVALTPFFLAVTNTDVTELRRLWVIAPFDVRLFAAPFEQNLSADSVYTLRL